MSIFDWLLSLDEDQRHELGGLTHLVNDGEHERVDALVPELIAEARRREQPWVEVFVRHWHLQSVVLHRHDARRGLAEAVSLLERAHRDDARDCPQTTCVTQDVCKAYAIADGPGFAKERLRVSAETLDRIDPSWPCFECVSMEHASALYDAGRHADSLAFVEEQEAKGREFGAPSERGRYAFSRARALLALDEPARALPLVEEATTQGGGQSRALVRRQWIARILAALGRFDESREALPAWEQVRVTGDYQLHAETLEALIRGGVVETMEQYRVLAEIPVTLARRGAHRMAIETACLFIDLACEQGRRVVPMAMLELAEAQQEHLRADLGAKEALATRRARLEAMERPAIPTREQIDRELGQARQERTLTFDMLWEAWRANPEWSDICLGLAGCWSRLSFDERSLETLELGYRARPSSEIFMPLAYRYLEAGREEELDALLVRPPEDEHTAVQVALVRATVAERRRGPSAAIDILQPLHADDPSEARVATRLANLLRGEDRLAESLQVLRAVANARPEASDIDWDVMVVATLLGDWPVVHEAAARLGLSVETKAGPIDEKWELCRVQYSDRADPVLAGRTGPVTARVLSITGPEEPERHHEVVVFDAAPLNRQQLEEAQEDDFVTCVYAVDSVLEPGTDRSFTVDGVHPGEEAIDALNRALQEHGVSSTVVSSDEYRLSDPSTHDDLPGVFMKIAVPREGSLEVVACVVRDFVDGQAQPLVYPELLTALGDVERAAEHRKLAEDYGMI